MEEVLRKWDAIDDEIWAKAIVMERNKRVAKVGKAVKQLNSEVSVLPLLQQFLQTPTVKGFLLKLPCPLMF